MTEAARIEKAAGRHGYRRNELVGKIMAHVRARRTQQFLGNLAMIHVPSPGQPRLPAGGREPLAVQRVPQVSHGGELEESSWYRQSFVDLDI